MKKSLSYLLPAVVSILFIVLGFTQFSRNSDNRIYDLLLRYKPEITENKDILLLDVDDLAISKVGVWPWSRSIMADGLILLKEMGAKYCVFDIEYTERSPRGIDSAFLEKKLPQKFEDNFTVINENISDLFAAVAEGSLSVNDAVEYIDQLVEINNSVKDELIEAVQSVSRDNDKYLGQAVKYFGKAFLTVNMFKGEDDSVPGVLKQYASENIALKNISGDNPDIWKADDIRPAIFEVIKNAEGAGFPNVVIDEDGVRRRIDLLRMYNEDYFAQLSFRPLLDWLGNPDIYLEKERLILKNAELPDGSEKDIEIKLVDGQLLINWPYKTFAESFRHMTYWYLVLHKEQEASLISNLKLMQDAGYLDYYEGDAPLLDIYTYAEKMFEENFETGDTSNISEYREMRELFFSETASFLNSGAVDLIVSDIDSVLASDDVPDDIKAEYSLLKSEVPDIFKKTSEIADDIVKTRKILKENLSDAYCILGHTGTSTTDIGVNPFEKEYMNVGTHASVANTILSGKFLTAVPMWVSPVSAFFFSFLAFFIIKRRSARTSIIIGFIIVVFIILLYSVLFITTGIYFPMIVTVLSVLITFIVHTMLTFVQTSKEKAFIKTAFGHYLSSDVISQLIDNPDYLKLGGEKKLLTAMFTDVKGFSSISEKLDPTDLVKLLNDYLTAMSDIILDLQGTIDKYEGDAIISFFGAPVEFNDHAAHACLAAVRMKKVEEELNRSFAEQKRTPSPLLTRIGINTGEMVVGNMGTARKMDYTMMGNSVNLAARLEGVNKQYGTWKLISHYTYGHASNKIFVRKLDQVRVVGINEPVQLYELLDEKSEVKDQIQDLVDIFHKGLEKFQQQDWKGADELFRRALKVSPDDGPAKTYVKRCSDFTKNPPPKNWDGVFNLTSK